MNVLPEAKVEGSPGLIDSTATRQGIIPAENDSKDENLGAAEDIQVLGEPNGDTQEQKKAARNYRWRLIMGLLLPSILEALDTTIIAAALSFIASEFSIFTDFQTQYTPANPF